MDPLAIRVCNLPRDFYRMRTKSIIELLVDSGYVDNPDKLLRSDVVEVLRSDPSLVQEWINYSGDKRVSSGWFLLPNGNVGHLGPIEDDTFHVEMEPRSKDLNDACMEFIFREIGDIRKNALKRRAAGLPMTARTRNEKVD